MGKHTDYWKEYTKSQVRGSLRILGVLAIGLLAVALAGALHEQLGRSFPWVMSALGLALVLALFYASRNVYDVHCPECGTSYKRSKWHGQCPSCGLRLLQPDL